jgi:TRAP-type mannitol/chloroaromatic compound transport system permease large subunit
MFGLGDMWILIGVLLVVVLLGVHVAVALGITAVLGIYLMTRDFHAVYTFIGGTAYEALRDYVFAVIPLFMLMGDFLGKCGAATDLYALINRMTRRIPGRLAVATVLANAVFAFVTGVSIAAAAAFSRIAYPEMKKNGYDSGFALGCIAGSACLGMLIPPSVLMIVWGVLTEQAIGKIFIAGIIPGFVVVFFYCVYIFWVAVTAPEIVGEAEHQKRARAAAADAAAAAGTETRSLANVFWSTMAVSAASGSACSRRRKAPASARRWRSCSRSPRACAPGKCSRSCCRWGAPRRRCCCSCSPRSCTRAPCR